MTFKLHRARQPIVHTYLLVRPVFIIFTFCHRPRHCLSTTLVYITSPKIYLTPKIIQLEPGSVEPNVNRYFPSSKHFLEFLHSFVNLGKLRPNKIVEFLLGRQSLFTLAGLSTHLFVFRPGDSLTCSAAIVRLRWGSASKIRHEICENHYTYLPFDSVNSARVFELLFLPSSCTPRCLHIQGAVLPG